MRILEARDGFIKFESNEKVSSSSFLEIDDLSKRYIAQVIKVSNIDDRKVGYAKILYLYDGSLYEYDKSLPNINAQVKLFSFDVLKQSIQADNPVTVGFFVENEEKIAIDKKHFDKNMLVSIDSPENCDRLVSNLKSEFARNNNVIIIDMLGLTTGRKFTASVDFKLPLNTDALSFMYEDCLNDATSDSKNLVKEIFADLAEYSKSVPFLPFNTLKTIVDDMVDKSHVFKLLVLKNKLAKFDRLGYFAANSEEASNLNKILKLKESVIDLSKLDAIFQNRYLETVYSLFNSLETKPQVFVIASNSINKKSLKTILTTKEIPATLITHSRFKFINEIKSMFSNFIIEPSFSNNEVFKTYKTFLENMPKNTYLVFGECSNYIPLVSLNKEYVIETPEIEEISETAEDIVVEPDNEQSEISEEKSEAKNLYAEIEEAFTDPQFEAIDKKSEDLIEKATEDLDSSAPLNIFSSEEDLEDESDNDPNNSIETDEYSEIIETSEEEIEEDETITEEFSEEDLDNTEVISETESSEEEEEKEEFPTEIHPTVEDIPTQDETSEIIEEIETDKEEIIEIDVPKDMSEFTKEAEEIANYEPIEEVLEDTENLDILESTDEPLEEIVEISETQDSEELDTIGDYEPVTESIIEQEEPLTEEYIIDENIQIVNDVMPITEDEEFDEIVELDPNDISDEDILIDFEDEEIEESLIDPDSLDKEIIEDVDKVFTTIKDDTISDSDLDFIDELNEEPTETEVEEIGLSNDFEELPEMVEEADEESFLEPLQELDELQNEENKEKLETKTNSTPMVPIYEAEIPAEDLVQSDSLEQGDSVIHAKYGSGIVEKMIKYGSKTLYSINFDNVGRRLLDPTLTEIKKS